MSTPNSETSIENNRILTFVLDGEKYGIEIDKVREIIAKMKTTSVPKTPDFIEGVMNLRGNIIPVVDMRLKFDMGEAGENMYAAIVIVMVGNTSIGFTVDSVEEVLTIDLNKLSEAPDFGNKIDTSFIKNVAQHNEEVIMILNLEKIFEEDELQGLEKMAILKDET